MSRQHNRGSHPEAENFKARGKKPEYNHCSFIRPTSESTELAAGNSERRIHHSSAHIQNDIFQKPTMFEQKKTPSGSYFPNKRPSSLHSQVFDKELIIALCPPINSLNHIKVTKLSKFQSVGVKKLHGYYNCCLFANNLLFGKTFHLLP